MTLELLKRHLLAAKASLELLGGQLHAMELQLAQMIQAEQAPKAVIELPARCREEEMCGRLDPEAVISRPGWTPMCRGCGIDPRSE